MVNWMQYFRPKKGNIKPWSIDTIDGTEVFIWKSRLFGAEVWYYYEGDNLVRLQVKGFTITHQRKTKYPIGDWMEEVYARQFKDLRRGIRRPTKWYKNNL